MSLYVLALENAVKTSMTAVEFREGARLSKTDGKAFQGRVRRRTQYRGAWYDSKREASYAADLDMLLMAGKIKGWDRQRPFIFAHEGVEFCRYVADFVIWFTDGRMEVHDAKATWKDARGRKRTHNDRWPLIKRMMKIFYGIDVKEV